MTQSGHPDYDLGEQHWLGDAIAPSLLTESARSLLQLWTSKRQGQPLVRRSALMMEDLVPWLGCLTIYDYLADEDDFFCRLFGENTRRMVGIDLTRQKLSTLPPEIGGRMRARYLKVLKAGEPMLCHTMGFNFLQGRARAEQQPIFLLILPLSRSGTKVDCMLVLNQPRDI